jgi:hypothetical protein
VREKSHLTPTGSIAHARPLTNLLTSRSISPILLFDVQAPILLSCALIAKMDQAGCVEFGMVEVDMALTPLRIINVSHKSRCPVAIFSEL